MKYLFFIALLSISWSGYGQESGIESKTKIPPSPNAESFGKYEKIPIGLFTGTTSVSIPLWEIKEGDYKP
ncbi:hypothetical protein [Pararcticibacter amylolyticus]|uniref:Uncharacterized protein n=1 Tax=Pararcticibacter amylolyticus TaxID=2173175 RepID=A0A2U2P9F5_9SPHI|nr:hypothetical protein [Pararcticibacter amylolyticus]PWG78000.1 hypothetical protein DDR33_24520 [Pararcticibacter amylolyticus]